MTVAVNQAHALLATISELPRQEARDRAIGLAKELLASGEWRLCLDLCDAVRPVADEPGRLVECELIRADALMGMTEFSKAHVILEATSEIAQQGASSIPLNVTAALRKDLKPAIEAHRRLIAR